MSAPRDAADGEELEPIRIEMDKRVDLALSLVVAAFGAFAFYLATDLRVGGYPDPVTARGLPLFTGAYLFVAGLVLAARRIRTWSVIPGHYTVSEGHEDEPSHPASANRSFLIMALLLGWVLTVRPVGYLIVTPLMLAAMLWLMDVRSVVKLVLFPVLFTLGSWIMFSLILGVTLPMGLLAPLARSWGLLL